jgi:hypothetical protein
MERKKECILEDEIRDCIVVDTGSIDKCVATEETGLGIAEDVALIQKAENENLTRPSALDAPRAIFKKGAMIFQAEHPHSPHPFVNSKRPRGAGSELWPGQRASRMPSTYPQSIS